MMESWIQGANQCIFKMVFEYGAHCVWKNIYIWWFQVAYNPITFFAVAIWSYGCGVNCKEFLDFKACLVLVSMQNLIKIRSFQQILAWSFNDKLQMFIEFVLACFWSRNRAKLDCAWFNANQSFLLVFEVEILAKENFVW